MVLRIVLNPREWPILLAERHERAGRLSSAEQIYRHLLARQPRRPSALIGLGRLLLRERRFEEAVDVWRRMADLSPRRSGPAFQLARALHRSGRLEAAVDQYFEVLRIDPGHEKAGEAIAELGRQQRFVTASAPQGALALAREREKASEWEQAEQVYRGILQENPLDRIALHSLARLLSRDASRMEQALDLWRMVADGDAGAPTALVQRAILLERGGRFVEAEAEYRAALKRAPMDATALMGLARLTFAQAKWSVASATFETLHKLNPNRADVLVGLGRSQQALDRVDEALASYAKVLTLDPGNANALLYSGRLLRQLGRTQEAITAWSKVCARTPGNADAWYELVFMLGTAERDAEALAALDAAEAALPATVATWVKLGLAAQAAQFHDRAVDYFERAIAAEPTAPIHRTRLGQHYFRQGIVDGAFHHLLASRELKPSDPTVAKQLVDAIHALNLAGVDHVSLAAAAPKAGELLVPERLFRLVRELADTTIAPYEPVSRRIIAVTSSLAPGGAERQVVNLLRGLSDCTPQFDLALFCISLSRRTQRDFFLPLLAEKSVAVVTPPDTALDTCLVLPEFAPYARLVRSFPADMAPLIAFWMREFRRRRPQVVHAWQDATNLTAVIAALLAGVPRIVLGTRSVRPDNPRRRLKRFMREGYQAVVGHPAVVLSNNSRAGAEDYADWLGIDTAAIKVVHNGIDFDQIAKSVDPKRTREVRESLGIASEAPVIGSAFRMSEEKRPLLWVETAAAIQRLQPGAHFIIYGDGPMRADMQELATRLGIADRLHLPGRQDEIGSCYKAMDVVLLTSRHEGLPNVLLEAQSLAVPVVAPDVGGVGETIVNGVTGWAVRHAEPRTLAAALAEHVDRCLTEPGWMARARATAPAFVRQRFGLEAMVQRTLDVYGIAP